MPALLSAFGDLERLISEDLYPHRFLITLGLTLVLGTLAFVAVSRGMYLAVWRHRLVSTMVGLPLLVAAAFAGDFFLSPLWERSFLEEARPLEASSPPDRGGQLGTAATPAASAAVTRRGTFKGADDFHFGRGDALLVRAEDGSYVLRLENFSVRNGPDLYVYLSQETDGKRVSEALNLGRLKATDGAFNYEIPASVNPGGVKSVLIWCKQFAVLFAIARFES